MGSAAFQSGVAERSGGLLPQEQSQRAEAVHADLQLERIPTLGALPGRVERYVYEILRAQIRANADRRGVARRDRDRYRAPRQIRRWQKTAGRRRRRGGDRANRSDGDAGELTSEYRRVEELHAGIRSGQPRDACPPPPTLPPASHTAD